MITHNGDREVLFWDVDDGAEELTHDNIDDAVEEWWDGIGEELPGTITVYGWARTKVLPPGNAAESLTETLLEWLDEEHDFEGEFADDNMEAILPLAEEFVKKASEAYTSWACEIVTSEVVNVREWAKERVGPE